MKNLSRGAWIAIAAVIAVPTTVAIAKSYHHGGWSSMSPEARQRLDEGKIAGAKAALKLTAEQEKLWEPVEAQLRTFMKDHQDRRAERQKKREEYRKLRADGKTPDAKRNMAERLEKMSERMSQRAARMKTFSEAFTPFYNALSEEQKEVLRPLARKFMRGMGPRHHGGKRWAQGGGWGDHEGKGRHGHHRWGGRHGGPAMDGNDQTPANTPDTDDDADTDDQN